jgi:ribonuclease HI
MGEQRPYVEYWTDGSGTTRANPGGWAYILEWVNADGKHIRKETIGGARYATNNRMELSGPLNALRSLTRSCRVKLHTDSKYVANAFRQGWIDVWERKSWHKVKNVDLWQALLREVERHDVEWVWVPGHAGVANNVRADRLAGEARRAIIACAEAGSYENLPFTLDDAQQVEATAEQL